MLNDSELKFVTKYNSAYNRYVSVMQERINKLPKIPTDFTIGLYSNDIQDAIRLFIINQKRLIDELCLESNKDGYIRLRLYNTISHHDLICKHIRNQAYLVAVSYCTISGHITDSLYAGHDVYREVMLIAHKCKLPFCKSKIVYCEDDYTHPEEIPRHKDFAACEAVTAMNGLNKAVTNLVSKHFYGVSNADKLSSSELHTIGVVDFIKTFANVYNYTIDINLYVMNDMKDFIL